MHLKASVARAVLLAALWPAWAEVRAAEAAPGTATEAAIGARLKAAGLEQPDAFRPYEIAAMARAAGIGEPLLLGWIESLLADCLKGESACREGEAPSETLGAVFRLTAEVAGASAHPLLFRLEAREVWWASHAIDRILERTLLDRLAATTCSPPSQDELAAARASLWDFLAVGCEQGALTPRPLAPRELSDLAYFLASTEAVDRTPAPLPPPPAGSAAMPEDSALPSALLSGDLAAAAEAARRALAARGFPNGLDWDTASLEEYARLQETLRTFARVAEARGELAEAEAAYRLSLDRAGPPTDGADARWLRDVAGAIRTGERLAGCRRVAGLRLLATDDYFDGTYGTARLSRAGFDVPRLYRGAMATLGRGAGAELLEQAFSQAAPGLAAPALQRLRARGPESFERSVLALEGLADLEQRQAIPRLLDLAAWDSPSLRARALAALGRLAERPEWDPCARCPFGTGRGSSEWRRPIRPLGRDCGTRLSASESRALTERLLPDVERGDEDAISAAGAIGSSEALPALRALVSADELRRARCDSRRARSGVGCPNLGPGPAARRALARIEQLERNEREAARRCKP